MSGKITSAALDLIRHYEAGGRLIPGHRYLTCYLCPAGKPTIGYGHTRTMTPADVGVTKISVDEAERLLHEDVEYFSAEILDLLTVEADDHQFSAMMCLAFNIGIAAFKTSTVLRRHNAGDFDGAAAAFSLWIKATVNGKKKTLPGLVKRRATEAEMYLRLAGGEKNMPQAIEPAVRMRPLARSRTVIGGGTALTTAASIGGALQIVTPLIDQAGEFARTLANVSPWLIVGVLAAGIAYMLWRRWDDARENAS
ncbi:MAG: lysozyme [Alphaproteobacteria bacterium]|nr:lysozyme [Alphaproteobacteria bacterium]